MNFLNPRAKSPSLNLHARKGVSMQKALCYRAESFFYLRYLWDIGPGGVAYDGQVKIGQKG